MSLSKKDKADLAIWLSEALESTHDAFVFWRVFLKFMNDFENDHNVKITIEPHQWKKPER